MAIDVQAQSDPAGVSAAAAVAAPELEQPGAVEPPTKVDPSKKNAKDSKSKSSKGSKSSKDANTKEPVSDGPSVAGHPRAAHQVARAKSWGGLVGFVLGGYLSMSTHTFVETGVRALVAGVVCYLVAWAAAVFVWRHLVVLEIKGREQELLSAANPNPAGPTPGQPAAERTGARATS